jgi:hypothetical protein
MNANIIPDKKLAAVCGLFCPSCTFYIASTEDPKRLMTLSERFGIPQDKMECHGCRSDKRGFYCEARCVMRKCAASKNIEFCGECADYPCKDLKDFQAQMAHRSEIYESQEKIKKDGFENWFGEMAARYSCPECGAINSAYDIACRKCGAEPGSEYVKMHKEEIMKHYKRMGV